MTTKTAIANLSKTVLSAKASGDFNPFFAFIEERKAAGYPTALEYMIVSLALSTLLIRDRLKAHIESDKQVAEEALQRLAGGAARVRPGQLSVETQHSAVVLAAELDLARDNLHEVVKAWVTTVDYIGKV